QLVDGKAQVFEYGKRGPNVRVVSTMHPERAGLNIQRFIFRSVQTGPQLVGPLHHLRVDAIGTVDRADDAGLAAGARSRVAGTPRIDECDLRSEAKKVQRGPSAERARSDH